MFFLEGSVLGHCFDKLAFLLLVHNYLKDWMRAIIYMGYVWHHSTYPSILSISSVLISRLAFVPICLFCLSASTIIGLALIFVVGAFNFILAIGQK